MSMESAADRQIFAAPCLEEPPAKPHTRGPWFFAASFAAHLAVLGMIWFLGSLLPPTGNGDFDGVVITLTYGKPGSGTAGEPSGAGGGSAQTEQNAEPQADAAAPAAEAAAAQKETSPAHQEQEKPAESTVADSQSPLAIPRLAEKTAVKEKPQPAKIDKTTKATPRKEQNVQHREQADNNMTAKVADLKPSATAAGASSGAESGAGSGASQSKLQGQGMSLAEGSGQGRGSGSSGQGNGAASEGQGDAGGYLKGNYEYIKKRIRKYLEYSPQAKRMGIQGLVYVAFTITRDGSAQNVELRTSSGFDSLDESALEAVHRASPFAPPPQAARVVVPIQFSLK
ncbi:energy transducer TonB [Desulfovibrio desulfuricans]|uniref:energy transducer TonB n=1 Tax=Desulfovibrio desulfuricans TaxID=876 RepID=UPI0017854488|nr:energy transducer TonB [Desulfovibrio desulfuricans]MBD8896306.1 energy transducer TonB [Desulfovibrio desulfuricans]